MRRSFGMTFVLAVLALFAFAANEAAAQARPAFVKNVDEPGRLPYNATVEFTRTSCSFSCSNFVTFGPVLLFDAPSVPTGKRLVVQWVSADLPSDNSLNSISFQRSPIIANQQAIWQFHGPYYPTNTPPGIWGMNSGAFFTVEPGESPHLRVKLGAANNFVASISISGYLIDAN